MRYEKQKPAPNEVGGHPVLTLYDRGLVQFAVCLGLSLRSSHDPRALCSDFYTVQLAAVEDNSEFLWKCK